MPRFSIIVPVYNVMEFLPDCLDSILSQSFDDFEVIAVDDASPDGSAELLRSYAERDSRVRPVVLPENVGMGSARNIAIERALGRYLLCVDSDDLLADGALQAISDRIAETNHPELLFFNFARLYADGREVIDVGAQWLRPAAELAPLDRTDLLEIFPSAWNKAYRTDFVREHGFAFPDGYYEDLCWTYTLLMTATRVATMEQVCYLYRQRESGSILSSAGQRHHDLFTQYDRVFAYLDAHPETEVWRPRMVDRLTRHIPAVLEVEQRIPVEFRRGFFHDASESFRKHRPRGYQPTGPRTARVKVALIEHDNYRLFRIFQLANASKRRLKRPSRPIP